ncbi:MAG: hypothetical protein ACYC4L_07250 [Chloroflexota bacterium]
MAPIEYIPILQEYYESSGRGEYPLYLPQDDPWTPLPKPLAQCRVALICSAGFSRRDQQLFPRLPVGDFSVRSIPLETPPEELIVNYDYYDHRDADQDPNVILPLAPLRQLAAEGLVGGACPTVHSMGIGRWADESTPEFLEGEVAAELYRRCRGEGADAALLVPG